MSQGNEWPRSWTNTVGAAIQTRRQQLGISAEDLSDACAKRGLKIARPALANLENGRREGITVHQLVVIADALRIPPLALLFPNQPEPIEYMPGRPLTWDQCMISFTGDDAIVREPTSAEFESLGSVIAKAMEQELARQRNEARGAARQRTKDKPDAEDVSRTIATVRFKPAGEHEERSDG